MKNYTINVIETLAAWENIREPWNNLLKESSSDNIFLTWEWLYSWAEVFLDANKRNLFIVTIYDGDVLLGVAPWYISSDRTMGFLVRQIMFIGEPEGASDYLDVFVKKGKEESVSKAIYNFLLTDVSDKWDSLKLNEIPQNSRFLLHFLEKAEELGKLTEIQRGAFCPIAVLPSSDSEFFSALSTHRRQQFNRDLKILKERHGAEHVTFSGFVPNESLERFLDFYENKKDARDERFRAFLHKFSQLSRGMEPVGIDFLASNGADVAALFHLYYNATASLYLMAVDKGFNQKVSVGNVMVGLAIKNAIKKEFAIYDFLKGPESYKFNWSNNAKTSTSVIFYQRRIVTGISFLDRATRSLGKLLFR